MEHIEKQEVFLRSMMEIVLDSSPDLIFAKDKNLRYTVASKAFADLVGAKSREDLIGKSDFEIFDTQLAERYIHDDMEMLSNGEAAISIIEPIYAKDNVVNRYSATSKYVLKDENGEVIGIGGIGKDVTTELEIEQIKKAKERLKIKASTDALTGLLNRENIIKNIEKCIDNEKNEGIHALLFIDLDHFKEVNDTFGHTVGDEALRFIAQRLKAMFRENDLIGRVGGDEFLVFLENVENKEVILTRINEIFEKVYFIYKNNEKEISVTCSVGVAMCSSLETCFEQLYEEADKAMYKAKESGRNRIVFYS